MRVVIIADVYPPEISSAAHLMQELAEGLARRGHIVTVATAYPKHYLKENAKVNLSPILEERGVRVLRIKTLALHKNNVIIRGMAQLVLPLVFSWHLFRQVSGADAVIVYSPPMPAAFAGWFVKRLFGARLLLVLQDIFPQNAVDLGIMKNPVLIWGVEMLENLAYRAADIITFHSAGGRRFLIDRKKVPAEKVIVLPNWIDLAPFRGTRVSGKFREQYGLRDKFVVLFAGILGPAQGLEFVLKVADKVSDIPRLLFLFVGDGTEKPGLQKLAAELKLPNVLFKEFVSKDEYPELVAEMDAGLVALSPKNKTAFIPGKFLGYLAAGKPILAFLNRESDGFELMRDSASGYAAVAGDLNAAEQAVRKLLSSDISEVGKSGRRYAEAHLSLEKSLDKVENLLKPAV